MNAKHLILIGLAPLALACGTPEVDGQPDAADVANTTSALCTDNGAANHSAAIGSAPGSVVESTSPDASYGSPTCQGRYVVEATATSGKLLYATAGYDAVPMTENHCGMTRLRTIVYGARLKPNPPPMRPSLVWEQVGPEKIGFGTWTSFFGGPPFCQGPNVGFELGGQYVKVRVSARAEMPFFGGTIPVPVNASIRVSEPPPA